MKLESCRKLTTEVVQILNNDGKSIDNPKVSASALDGYFLSLAENKMYFVHGNTSSYDGGADHDDSPICYLLQILFKKIKFSTLQQTENSIKFLQPKNTYGYDEISTN